MLLTRQGPKLSFLRGCQMVTKQHNWQSPNGKCRRQTSMWSSRFTLQHKGEQAVDNEVSLLKTMAAQVGWKISAVVDNIKMFCSFAP